MKSKLLLGFIVSFLLIPLSFADAADTMNIKAQNVRVTEKEFYNVITIDIIITVPDIAMDDWILFSPIDFTIVNTEGKFYPPDPSECKMPTIFQMTGKSGPVGSFPVCYAVEKKYDSFEMYYKKELIGSFTLNETTPPNSSNDGKSCFRIMAQEEKDANPNRTEVGIPGIMKDGKCVTDNTKLDDSQINEDKIQTFDIEQFFSQLFDRIRALFNF